MNRMILVLAALLATVVAGCGSSSGGEPEKSDTPKKKHVDASYERQLRQIDDRLDEAMSTLFGQRSFAAEHVVAAQRALDSAARELEALDPPADIAGAHEQYLEGVRGFRPIIDKLAKAEGDPERVRAHLSDPEYGEVIQMLEQAKSDFEDAGYDL